MNARKLGAVLFGIIAIIMIGFTIYKVIVGEVIGFNEIVMISIVMMVYFSAFTWGTKDKKDGILQEEELGQRITEKSAKISYYVLIIFILVAVTVDWFVNETNNIFLLLILGIGMITLPFVEYLVAKKYQ